MTFDELPPEWQAEIRKLRGQVKALRVVTGRTDRIEDLPLSWQHEFSRLRRDVATTRRQRNEARAELAALRAERGTGRGAE